MSGRRSACFAVMVSLLMLLSLRSRIVPAVVVLAGLGAPAVADAFECSRTNVTSGPSLVWSVRSIPWYARTGLFEIFEDEAAAREEVLGSFTAWSDVACSDLEFPYQGEGSYRAGFDPDGDNENVVELVDKLWPYQAGAIAVTTTAYDTRTGVVVDADIEINGQGFRFRRVEEGERCEGVDTVMDLRNALTHEVGHVIGLEHPPNTARYAESTMYASAPACEIKKRSLEADDIEGICFIYPAGATTQQCYPPDGPSFAVVAEDDGYGGCASVPVEAGPIWLLAALLSARAASRRSRRSS